jgi:NADH dehydrogenase
VGGGFGGLNAAKVLQQTSEVEVTLIDKKNHHLFQPLLYQVATAGLNPADIATPIRAEFSQAKNITVVWGNVTHVDLIHQTVTIANPEESEAPKQNLIYDYLILACGASHSYFNHPEWEKFAPGLKTLEQATGIRRQILMAFEKAENEENRQEQDALLTFAVVGGGPTGVELAGAIADISRTVIATDFRRIDPTKAKIVLIEAGPRILATFDPELSKKAERDLNEMGVDVKVSTRVERIDPNGLQAGSEYIHSHNILWAAGVEAAHLPFSPEVENDRSGRIRVEPDLSIPNFHNVFVIGDMALIEARPGVRTPGLAPAAIQEGKHAAFMILYSIRGEPRFAFHYHDKGQMATIGKNRAIMQMGRVKLSGLPAWLAWLFVHVFYLVGFKNRISVLSQWAWSYMFSKRGARIITHRETSPQS